MSFLQGKIGEAAQRQPRARGALELTLKQGPAGTAIDRFRTSGATKVLFPRTRPFQAILINTAGGLTGGDRFDLAVSAGQGTDAVLTTQAAERAYRALEGAARVTTRLILGAGARLAWLPQETILYQGSALDRRLEIDLASDARLLMVEPLLFGRLAMGERLTRLHLRDRILLRQAGRPLYADALHLSGDAEAQLSRAPAARGARAMASLVFRAPEAPARLEAVRALLPTTGGASLLAPDLLVARLLAPDGFELRRALVPILETLKGAALPRSWSL